MRGFTAQVISLLGVALGLFAGAWIAPLLLPEAQTDWLPLASLLGAAAGATVLGFAAGRLAAGAQLTVLRVARPRPCRTASAGALIGGVARPRAGLGARGAAPPAALARTAQRRAAARRSSRASSRACRPTRSCSTLERIDPLPVLPQLVPRNLPEPDPSVLRSPGARAAAAQRRQGRGIVVRARRSRASGWVAAADARRDERPRDLRRARHARAHARTGRASRATVVYRDAGDDVAILRVTGSRAPLADRRGRATSRDRSSCSATRATARSSRPRATAGSPRRMLVPNADDSGVGLRRVVPLRGKVAARRERRTRRRSPGAGSWR